jgi:S1-C subfamily serine protease
MIRKLALVLLFLAALASLAAPPGGSGKMSITVQDGKLLAVNGKPLPRVFMGFSPLNLTPELREFFGAPRDYGVLVQVIKEGSPADRSGLCVGDIVIAIGGLPLEYEGSVPDALEDRAAGQTVRLELVRDKQPLTLSITLEKRELPSITEGVTPPVSHSIDQHRAKMRRLRAELDKELKELEKELAKPDGDSVVKKKK